MAKIKQRSVKSICQLSYEECHCAFDLIYKDESHLKIYKIKAWSPLQFYSPIILLSESQKQEYFSGTTVIWQKGPFWNERDKMKYTRARRKVQYLSQKMATTAWNSGGCIVPKAAKNPKALVDHQPRLGQWREATQGIPNWPTAAWSEQSDQMDGDPEGNPNFTHSSAQ